MVLVSADSLACRQLQVPIYYLKYFINLAPNVGQSTFSSQFQLGTFVSVLKRETLNLTLGYYLTLVASSARNHCSQHVTIAAFYFVILVKNLSSVMNSCLIFSSFLGPCPPCPQMVTVSCHCQKSAPQGRRCSSRTWSCGQKCSKVLSCKEHQCEVVCHEGPCPPCPRKSTHMCQCGLKKEERPCHAIEFQCVKVSCKKSSSLCSSKSDFLS